MHKERQHELGGEGTLSNPPCGLSKGLQHFCQLGVIKRIQFLIFKNIPKAFQECSCRRPPPHPAAIPLWPAEWPSPQLLPRPCRAGFSLTRASPPRSGFGLPPPGSALEAPALAQAIPNTLSPPRFLNQDWSPQGWQWLSICHSKPGPGTFFWDHPGMPFRPLLPSFPSHTSTICS